MVLSDRKLVTPSITAAVREEVSLDLSVQDAIARDYVNLSALARMLSPLISVKLEKKVNEQSIITALKRLRGTYSPASSSMGKVIGSSIVNVRTRVSKLSVEKTKRTLQVASSMMASHQEDFIQVSESLSSITMIVDQKVHKNVRKELHSSEVLEEGDDYAAITIQSPKEIIDTPGCVATFYNQLSRRHVNVEDTVSCHTDTIVVVKMKDVGSAFEALTELIDDEARKLAKSST